MLSDIHLLHAGAADRHQNSQTRIVDLIDTLARPADHSVMIKIIMQRTVSMVFPQFHQGTKPLHRRKSVMFNAVIISVEHTRISFRPQKDQRIGMWLKPLQYKGFQRLPRLGVMIVHKCHRQIRTVA